VFSWALHRLSAALLGEGFSLGFDGKMPPSLINVLVQMKTGGADRAARTSVFGNFSLVSKLFGAQPRAPKRHGILGPIPFGGNIDVFSLRGAPA
jgi:hypothetical protein